MSQQLVSAHADHAEPRVTRSPVGVMTGVHDSITDADDAFLAIVGYTREDLAAGRIDWRAMTPPEHVHLDEAGIEQALRGGFTTPYQKEFFRKDGSRVPVLLVCAFVPGVAGQWMGYVVDLSAPVAQAPRVEDASLALRAPLAQELYDRLIAELVRERARVLAVMDSTEVVLWAVDPRIRLLSANASFHAVVRGLLGRDVGIGEPMLEVGFPEDLLGPARVGYERALRGERTTIRASVAAGGEQRTFIQTYSPILDPIHGILGVSCVAQDDTAHTRAEARLRASEAKFRMLADASPLGVYLNDADGRCVYVNSRVAAIWGRPAEEIEGTGWAADIHPDDAARVTTRREAAMAARETLDLEFRLVRPDGTERRVRVRCAPVVDDHGEIAGYVGSVDDVTSMHQEAARARQREKMEALGTLAGGIAHDFNNMLAVIMTHVDLAAAEAQRLPSVAGSLREIQAASLRARDLVRQILTFSRRADTHRVALDLAAAVRESCRLFQPVLPPHVELVLDVPDEPMVVEADATGIEQVMLNLCANAQHAMREVPSGTLTVRLRREESRDGGWLVLTVQDTGVGMPDAVRERVFEPFFTTKPVGEGTGMGMAVSHGIIAGAGGTIAVDSAVGAGTTITIRLPESHATPSPARAARAPGCRGRVLLAEDLTSLRRPLETVLTRAGYAVVGVSDGLEALAAFDASPDVDLLVTDIEMPHMAGPQLAQEIRARRPMMPVVLMTGGRDAEEATAAPRDPRTSLLVKPFLPRELVALVDRVLGHTSA